MIETRPRLFQQEVRLKPERHLTYNPDFDSEKYAALQIVQRTRPEEYEQRKALLDAETLFNLKTMLGERYNAGLSVRQDRLRDGKIYSAHSDEPLRAVYERGRDYRFPQSSQHDRLREQAEIDGFVAIEAVLGNAETPVGTMMVSFSPPGGENSVYRHNFYDIFTLKEVDGIRSIEAVRYSSALSRQEYVEHAARLQPGYFAAKEVMDLPYDAYFLRHPLRLEPGTEGVMSAADLHDRFHKDHDTLAQELYEALLHDCAPFLHAYLKVMTEQPWAVEERNLTLNALLNASDHREKQLRRKQNDWVTLYERQPAFVATPEAITFYGRQTVREVATGCGFSGGFGFDAGQSEGGVGSLLGGVSALAPFSVLEFGQDSDRYGKRTFTCPHCKHENKRPYNKLIKYCQNTESCGKDVSC